MMVTSAVLGAAAGTGLALLVAMTIVVYRYYSQRRSGKYWNDLERFGDSKYQKFGSDRSTGKKDNKTKYTVTQKEFNISKEQHIVQPVSTMVTHSTSPHSPIDTSPVLSRQSHSYPGGKPHLNRTPSVSSQSSLDSITSKQSHRGSSPQIRTFAPDGRSSTTGFHHLMSGETNPSISRSPSPASYHRAASLDIRCSSPSELRTSSPSQSSLASLSSSLCNSPIPSQSPRGTATTRCLSPLLIPQTPGRIEPMAPPASPLGALQPDLYQRREAPLYLGNRRSGPSLGRLHLRLQYDFDRSDLHVHLIEAQELASSDQGGFNDPYVRLTLSPPVDTRKRQTTIHRNEPNPYFDEHFKFPVSHEELQEKTLILQVFDYDRFSRNDVVGEMCISMDETDITLGVEIWGEITKNKKPPEELQEVLLSLSYLPSAERLTVVLLKARNLFLPPEKENIDPFVKVYLLSGGKRVKKRKTAARKGNCNPVWNEALTFNIASNNLANSAVEICVMDQGNDLIGNNPLLGCCVIGPHEKGPEREHWCDMTQSPRKAVAMWHTLR